MIIKCETELELPTDKNDLVEWVTKLPQSARVFVAPNGHNIKASWCEQK